MTYITVDQNQSTLLKSTAYIFHYVLHVLNLSYWVAYFTLSPEKINVWTHIPQTFSHTINKTKNTKTENMDGVFKILKCTNFFSVIGC